MVGFSEKAHQLGFSRFSDIPEHLVYEEWDGVPILYKGIKEYALQNYNLDHLEMGSSIFQSLIVEFILGQLYGGINRKIYAIVTNELGLHLGYRNNLSNDIAIIERNRIQNKRSVKYATVPPKVAIEVDVRADYEQEFESFNDYINQKTQKLLDFGVEKVFWVTTKTRKIFMATQNQNWVIMDWDSTIEVMENCNINLKEMLDEEEINY